MVLRPWQRPSILHLLLLCSAATPHPQLQFTAGNRDCLREVISSGPPAPLLGTPGGRERRWDGTRGEAQLPDLSYKDKRTALLPGWDSTSPLGTPLQSQAWDIGSTTVNIPPIWKEEIL